MIENGEYECDHLPGDVLVAKKKHGERQYMVESKDSGRKFFVHMNHFDKPHLSFAHVADADCMLRKIGGEDD